MKTIKDLKELIKQAKASHRFLMWNDPESIDGNSYSISYLDVHQSSTDDDEDEIVYIRYNDGMSEAHVYVSEISIDKRVTMLDRYIELAEIVNGWYQALPFEGLDMIFGMGALDITLEGDEMEEQLDQLFDEWNNMPFYERCMIYDNLKERFYEFTKL